jgi:hypothetical protein
MSWWASKVRQTRAHLRARVRAAERVELATWLTPAQLALFDSMHRADRRHGLDVVTTLRRVGVDDREVLLAGLLHDSGKGATGLVPRIVWSLGEVFGERVRTAAGRVPGMARALDRLRAHPERSAELALAAGCTDRTADLIRHQEAPRDPRFGPLLKLADEAN